VGLYPPNVARQWLNEDVPAAAKNCKVVVVVVVVVKEELLRGYVMLKILLSN
jgi:hypothetical protein